MLTLRDHLRLRLKALEFALPLEVQRPLVRLGGLPSPYLPQDHELKAIFIHIPKSAGTSIRKALYDTKSFHIPATRYKVFDRDSFDEYFKFCFVRNPWSRLLSAYHYLCRRVDADPSFPDHRWATHYLKNSRTFEDFVMGLENPNFLRAVRTYIHFRDQLDWITEPSMGKRVLIVDYVGKYEALTEGCEYISHRLGRAIDLPLLRKSDKEIDYRSVYSSRMVDIAADIYKRDIKAFDYHFE